MAKEFSNLPDFDSLPKVKGMPQGCAWGIFDKDGKKDHIGCLNLLTKSVVQAALREAKDGSSVSLNWSMGAIKTPGFQRKGLVHHWDSLVHFGHQPSGLNYNGTNPSKDDLIQTFGNEDHEKKFPTLNHWHDRGGLVGRGVLLDYRAWIDEQGKDFDCFSDSKIYVEDLEAVAKHQGTELKRGDILIIRTGFTEELTGISGEEQAQKLGSHKVCGVYGSKDTAKWFWNHHFAAVAGDAIAFEQIPPVKEDGNLGGVGDLVLHQWFLSLFGLNIGELWDLRELSKVCKEKGRWSFLLTSVPLNVPGAVGSPPNALAVF